MPALEMTTWLCYPSNPSDPSDVKLLWLLQIVGAVVLAEVG